MARSKSCLSKIDTAAGEVGGGQIFRRLRSALDYRSTARKRLLGRHAADDQTRWLLGLLGAGAGNPQYRGRQQCDAQAHQALRDLRGRIIGITFQPCDFKLPMVA